MKWVSIAFFAMASAVALADQSIYTDQLNSGWIDYSWASVNFGCTSPLHAGTHSIAVTETGGYQAIYLHHAAQSTASLQTLTFYIYGGGAGGQLLQVAATQNGNPGAAYLLPPLQAGVWTKVVVPLPGVDASNITTFDGFWIQDRSGTAQDVYYVDDISLTAKPKTVTDQAMYSDSLQNAWANWSWATTNLANTKPVHSGADSVLVTPKAANDAFYLSHAQQDASLYQTISFWINGGPTGGQLLQVNGTSSGTAQTAYNLPPLIKNTWQLVTVPLLSLGVGKRGDFDGFWIQDRSGTVQAPFYVDDITLSTQPPNNSLVTLKVDATIQTPISPYIYGVNSTDFAHLGTGFTFSRQGGNRLTAYNWETNASNAGSDYLYENDSLMGATNQPGWAGRTYVQTSTAAGVAPLLTVPTVGYVSADKNGGGDVRNTPNYLQVRFKQSLAVKPGGKLVYPPNPTDAFVYQDEFMSYIQQFIQPNFPVMVDLDNEPDLWSSTHAEVHPNPVTYAELLANNTTYATSIKNVVPNALVFGPVNYGWEGYRTLQNAPDANGRDFLAFYLGGMKNAGIKAGKRLLDVLDLHWYPEATGDGQRITTSADTAGLSAARMQAPRSLWDANYVEDSWITQTLGNKPINLLNGTLNLIHANYPGTKLSFTEYNYGGNNAISGAIAQADVLGIFGKYGVFAAANWGLSATDLGELAGFKAFINYDRAGAKFGDMSIKMVSNSSANPAGSAAGISCYAALDSTKAGRMTMVIINKTFGNTPLMIDLAGFTAASAKGFTVTSSSFTAPVSTPVTVLTDAVSVTVPPYSITTIELLTKS